MNDEQCHHNSNENVNLSAVSETFSSFKNQQNIVFRKKKSLSKVSQTTRKKTVEREKKWLTQLSALYPLFNKETRQSCFISFTKNSFGMVSLYILNKFQNPVSLKKPHFLYRVCCLQKSFLLPVTGTFGLFKCCRCVRTDGIENRDIFRLRKDCQKPAGDEYFKSDGVFSFLLLKCAQGAGTPLEPSPRDLIWFFFLLFSLLQ